MTHNPFFRLVTFFILFVFISTTILPAPGFAQSVLNLPVPGAMVMPTQPFVPTVMRGLKVHPDNPFRFDFIVDTGDSKLNGPALKKESEKLIKYFLAALTVPDNDFWVNLSPYEEDRIIPEKFGTTEMGRDLLAQDYLLKQLTASLIYPEESLGQQFWGKVFKRADEIYGTTNIPINTFNKVWIIPERAVVYETKDTAFVVESHLKVMLEEDYLAINKNLNQKDIGTDRLAEKDVKQLSNVSSQIVKEIILPAIEQEINEGKNFSQLRQVYHSLVLAVWFKKRLKESLLAKVYVGKNKVKGVDVEDKQIHQKIYEQYVRAFETGVYDYVKEDYDQDTRKRTAKRYSAGGMQFDPAALDQAIKFNLLDTPGEAAIINGAGKGNLFHEAVSFQPEEAAGDPAALSDAAAVDQASSLAVKTTLGPEEFVVIDEEYSRWPKRLSQLDKLKSWDEMSSPQQVLKTFADNASAPGTKVRFTASFMDVVDALKQDIVNTFDFEFYFCRIAGTNDWIAIKGEAHRAVSSNDTLNIERELSHLFDVLIHNHPSEQDFAIPSLRDIRATYPQVGTARKSLIRGRNGLTLFDINNFEEEFSDFYEEDSVRVKLVKELNEELKRRVVNGENSREVLIEILRRLKVKYDFMGWEDTTKISPIGESLEFKLSTALQSPIPSQRIKAINLLAEINKDLNNRFMGLFSAFAQDPKMSIQVEVLQRVIGPFIERYEIYKELLMAPFLNSQFLLVRALVSCLDYVPNVAIDSKYIELDLRKIPFYKTNYNGVVSFSYLMVTSIYQSLDYAIRMGSTAAEEIDKDMLKVFVSRLKEIGLDRGGESDPLVAAAEEFTKQWDLAAVDQVMMEANKFTPADRVAMGTPEEVAETLNRDNAMIGGGQKDEAATSADEPEVTGLGKNSIKGLIDEQVKEMMADTRRKFPKLMAARPKDMVSIDDPFLDEKFKTYLQAEVIDRKNFWETYPNLCKLFSEDSLEMKLIKTQLLNLKKA